MKTMIFFTDLKTKSGWTMETFGDVVLALYEYAYFEDVAEEFLIEAIHELLKKRNHFTDIKDLARDLAKNYI